MADDRDKAMIIILGFFRHKMAAMTKGNVSHMKELISTHFFTSRMMTTSSKHVDKAKELISLHEIAVSELVEKYIELVYHNS